MGAETEHAPLAVENTFIFLMVRGDDYGLWRWQYIQKYVEIRPYIYSFMNMTHCCRYRNNLVKLLHE